MMYDPILLIISLVFMAVGFLVSSTLKRKFDHYSREPLSSGMSGQEVAEKMLRDHGIYDVEVTSVEGHLNDHYDPRNKTVNLSPQVYSGRTVSAAAVAAHECGHAVQHAKSYAWLEMRSKLVPAVQFSSTIMNYLFYAMIFIAVIAPALGNTMLLLFIVCQAAITLFTLVTLPVEIDASRRGLAWLNSSHITRGQEHADAKDALTWAAYTYVVAALSAVATLLYLVARFMANSRRD